MNDKKGSTRALNIDGRGADVVQSPDRYYIEILGYTRRTALNCDL
jgi:hypothetical protein